jgi:hypothetical protein
VDPGWWLARPSKPVNQMTTEERRAWTRAIAEKLAERDRKR